MSSALAYEFWDNAAFKLVLAHCSISQKPPMADSHSFYVLVETSGSKKEHDYEACATMYILYTPLRYS
jgi:hypothetical protein